MNLAKLLVAIGATTSGFQRGIRAAEKRLDALERRSRGLRSSFGKLGGAMRQVAKIAATVLLAGILLVTAAIGASVGAAIAYEDAFAGVRKTVEATEPELQQLSRDIRQMATEIPIAATELAGLAEQAGALGVQTKNIKEFTRVTAILGVTTDVTAEAAADALGRLSNILGLNEEDYMRFASALVGLGNAGASTESEILEITRRMGSAGKLAGLTTPQIIGWASALASVSGLAPERAGTAWQTFLVQMTKLTAKGGKQLQIFAKTAGMTGKQFKKAFQKDANAAILKFVKGLGKLEKAERLGVIEDLGFNEASITRALLGVAESYDVVNQQVGASTDLWNENTAATEEAEKRFATTKSQLKLLKNILFDVAITLGDALLPHITPLIKGLGEWISKNRDLVESLGRGLGRALETVVGHISFMVSAVGGVIGPFFAGFVAGIDGLLAALGIGGGGGGGGKATSGRGTGLLGGIEKLKLAILGWIEQNKPLITQIGTFVGTTLAAFVTFIVTEVVPALISIGTFIVREVVPKVQAFINTLTKPGGVIESILRVAGPVIGALITGFGVIVTALFGGGGGGHNGRVGAKKGLIPAIGDLIGVLWGDGDGALAGVVKVVGGAFDILFRAIGPVIDKIAGLIGWVKDALVWLGKLGDELRATARPGVKGPRFPVTPGRAAGGPARTGQITWVGEEGPELVKWGGNGFVTPADLSADAMAGGGGGGGGDTYLTIHNPEPRAADDDIGRMLRRLEGLGITSSRGWSPA